MVEILDQNLIVYAPFPKRKNNMNLTRKCIFRKFKTFEEFWAQAQTVFLLPTARTLTDRINAYFFAYKVYDYWKLNWYLGEEETFFGKFFTELATKFYQLSKRETVYLKIFPNLHTWTNLLNIRTSEYDNLTDFVDKITSQVEGQKVNTAGGSGKQENFPDDPYIFSPHFLFSLYTSYKCI